jgi:crotonobetainyl-CoA:carnitine CoA-transferase CaiB-like acyl-CoA transferase
MDQVLKGIRVLDFGRFIAAPWCASLLADLGADVIRVERREGGEDRWVTPVSDTGDGATFLQCNRNKRSITLDTTKPEGAAITRKLVAQADVVVVNMPEASLKANGLDYATLKSIKPDIIVAIGTAFGNGGPYSERIGFDGIGQVMAGGVYRSGTKDQPSRTVVPYNDYGTALLLAFGVMAALYHRKSTGEGQLVEGSLLATALMMMNSYLLEEAVLRLDRPPQANRGAAAAPADLYRCKGGKWVLIQVGGQPMFKRWCKMVGKEEWFTDPRFTDDLARGTNGAVLNDFMQEWCSTRTKDEVLAAMESFKIPGSVVLSPLEALDDPHIKAMKYLEYINYPGAPRPAPIIETPVRLSKTPGTIRTLPPRLGEHTDAIMKELGFKDAEIADLRGKAII